MKNILVTGGAGFIGSNLCHKLVKNSENNILCIDNLQSGNVKNIEDLILLDNFNFIEQDINIPMDFKCNQIYNAACPASPVAYQKDPLGVLDTNYIGMKNLLELAKKNSAKIMQFSTSEVYGDPIQHPQKETYFGNVNPIGIRSCYDEGKRVAEALCFTYQRIHNIDIKVIRIFNTYGPNMDINDGRVISNFIVAALKCENIKIYGDGNQTRSFQYISDLINGIITYMNSKEIFAGPLNLGNPEELNILELAKLIIKKTNSKSMIEYCELPQDDPSKRKPDISAAKKHLNDWSPKVSLSEGLDKTISYFKERLIEA